MKLPFGYRFYLYSLVGFLCAAIWLQNYTPDYAYPYEAAFHANLILFCYGVLGVVYGYYLDGILKARMRRIPFIIYRFAYGCLTLWTIRQGYGLWNTMPSHKTFMAVFGASLILPLILALLPPFLLYWWEYASELPFIRRLLFGGGGSARIGTARTLKHRPAELRQSLLSFPSKSDEGVTSNRLFLGRSDVAQDPFLRLVGIALTRHMLLCGLTRSGKSATTIFNILLTWLSDIIIVDIKGELAETTLCRRVSKSFLQEQGITYVGDTQKHFRHGEAYVLDNWELTRFASNHYNACHEVDDIHGENAREIITAICDAIVLPESDRNKWVEEGAKSFLSGLIAYALATLPPEEQNLGAISDLLYGIDKDGNASTEAFKELILDMRTCEIAGGLPQQGASELDRMGDRQKGSVLDCISRSLKFASNPKTRKYMSRSDFSFKDIGTKIIIDKNGKEQKVIQTVYICFPPHLMAGADMRWLRLITNMAIVCMQKRHPRPKTDTLFIADEFAQLKQLTSISKNFGLLAGYKIKLFIVLQVIFDLQKLYPKTWNTMVANSTCMFFGLVPQDTETPKLVSNAIGKTIIRRTEGRFFKRKIVSETVRDLLTITEVAELLNPNSRKAIILSPGDFPIIINRLAFKSMYVNDEYGSIYYRSFGLDGLRGHFYDLYKAEKRLHKTTATTL